jgi:hypothetical protein
MLKLVFSLGLIWFFKRKIAVFTPISSFYVIKTGSSPVSLKQKSGSFSLKGSRFVMRFLMLPVITCY